jgi:hypothetical protein
MTVSDREQERAAGTGAGVEGAAGPGADRAGEGRPTGAPIADELVGEIVPEEVDWERLVRSYPWAALAVAAGAGFWLGLKRGPAITAALAGWATAEVTRRVNDVVGQEILG